MEIKEMLKEITGKSEKQISYAEDLRAEKIRKTLYVADICCDDRVDCEPREQQYARLAILVSELAELVASGAIETMTREEAANHRCLRNRDFMSILILLSLAEARDIIDFCKGASRANKDAIVAIAKEIVAANAEEAAAKKAAEETTEDNNNNNAETETTEEATTETKKTSYDKSAIMRSAWAKRKAKGNTKTFGECLKAAWAEAKQAAEVSATAKTATKRTETATAKATKRTTKTATAVYSY